MGSLLNSANSTLHFAKTTSWMYVATFAMGRDVRVVAVPCLKSWEEAVGVNFAAS